MATTLVPVAPAALGTSVATYYTVPAATKAIIKEIILYNSDNSGTAVDVHLIPSGGSAAVSNQIHGATISSKAEKVIALHTLLPAASFIQAKAGTDAVVSIRISVIEIS